MGLHLFLGSLAWISHERYQTISMSIITLIIDIVNSRILSKVQISLVIDKTNNYKQPLPSVVTSVL